MGNYFAGHGMCINGVVFLSPKEALAFLEGEATLVDLREGFEISGREFKVKTVVSLPYQQLAARIEMLPRDLPLVLADCVGLRSKECAHYLLEHGYESIAVLNGGVVAWEDDGLPMAIDKGEELSGGCVCQLKPGKLRKSRGR